MTFPSRRRFLLALVAGLALVLAAALVLSWQTRQHAEARLPVNDRLGGDFTLPSTRGAPLDTALLRGRVVLLTFGFTSCPDVCPMVMARLRQVVTTLGGDADRVQVVFVSFDPARDSLAGLTAYVQHFHPSFVGVTGSESEIAAVAARYGAIFMKEDSGSAAGYGFAHSDYIYLIDTAGRVRKLYDTHASTDEIAADVRLLQAEDRRLF